MNATSSAVGQQKPEVISKFRAAFEAHFRRTRDVGELERVATGYRNAQVQEAWMDWQAGAASVQPAAAASVQPAAAVATQSLEERVPGIGHPTTYADLARLTPMQLWNRWCPEGRSVDAREAFIAARTIPVVVPVAPAPAGQAAGRAERDAALLLWLMANPTRGMRWRLKAGKEQWQMVNDGEPSGKWGDFREVLQAAAAADPAKHADVEAGAYACAAPRPVVKTEAQHRADFELALKGNNLKRFHEVSHAAYKDAMIENMWRGWLRKAKFDGATQF